MELGSVESIEDLVGAGLGCGVVPLMALPAVTARRRTIIVRPLQPRLCRKLPLVMWRDKPLQRGLREVVQAIGAFADEFRSPAIKL